LLHRVQLVQTLHTESVVLQRLDELHRVSSASYFQDMKHFDSSLCKALHRIMMNVIGEFFTLHCTNHSGDFAVAR
jgi:hypothetical protein